MPQKLTVKQQLKVARMHARLGKQVKAFLQAANLFLPNLEEVDLMPLKEDVIDTPAEETVVPVDFDVDHGLDEDDSFEEQDEAEMIPSEVVVLPLPSNIISDKVKSSIKTLISVERELWKGQENDTLEGLRVALANKSLIFSKHVNLSKTTKQTNRAWDSIRNNESHVLAHACSYERAWEAFNVIGIPEDLLVYQKLNDLDLKTVKDVTKAKHYGQGSHSLA